MAHHDLVSNAASPNSSEEVDSHLATPATKLTTFSPDDIHDFSNPRSRGIVRSNVPPAFDLTITAANFNGEGQQGKTSSTRFNDPFTSASSFGSNTTKTSTDTSKLSPAAASFTPTTLIDSPTTPNRHGGANVSLQLSKGTLVGNPSNEHPSKQTPLGHVTVPERFSRLSLYSLSDNFDMTRSFSLDDGTSRSLTVDAGTGCDHSQVPSYFTLQTYPSLATLELGDLPVNGLVYVTFSDIRDADRAVSDIQRHQKSWRVSFTDPRKSAIDSQSNGMMAKQSSPYDGQLLVTADSTKVTHQCDADTIIPMVKETLRQCGDVMAFAVHTMSRFGMVFRVEFYDVRSSENAFLDLNGVQIAICTLTVSHFEPKVQVDMEHENQTAGPIIIGQEDSLLEKNFQRMAVKDHQQSRSVTQIGAQRYRQPSPPTRSFTLRKEAVGQHTPSPLSGAAHEYGTSLPLFTPPWSAPCSSYANYAMSPSIWSPYSPGAIGQERGSPLRTGSMQTKALARIAGRQAPDFAIGQHNVVDVERIRGGIDVRTTIMLRNIPNKIDQAMLKQIVDETSLGRYDFMYLRIDFANNCNVGYAFINFEDPIWILDFVNARAGRRWNRYNSDKVAEVSYATIQGRDCLIQKFRNSSVMLEHKSFRPKLFHTGTGPLAGTEEDFAPPDNPSKMRRSIENAEHVGLFAPRAGQSFRDEQRRHRSQFDRGTRLVDVKDTNGINDFESSPRTQTFRAPRPFDFVGNQFTAAFGSPYY